MKAFLIPAALAVLVAVGACGGRQAGGAPEIPVGDASTPPTSLTLPTVPTKPLPSATVPTGPVVTTGPSGVIAPPGYEELPPDRVNAKALPGDLYKEHRVWVSTDDRTIQLFAMAPDPCTTMEGTIQGSDKASVTVALAPMAQPQGGPEGQVCATVVTPHPVSVALPDALGDRQVVLTLG
ncbi:hypothetical protein ACFQV2_10070 [Actinokineospora soli]|uniref:Uncharacterized protein n=1 Tax=Actinokineospora soli TaxID=1048753 RepID=A0ABW2TJI2_9PSEU